MDTIIGCSMSIQQGPKVSQLFPPCWLIIGQPMPRSIPVSLESYLFPSHSRAQWQQLLCVDDHSSACQTSLLARFPCIQHTFSFIHFHAFILLVITPWANLNTLPPSSAFMHLRYLQMVLIFPSCYPLAMVGIGGLLMQLGVVHISLVWVQRWKNIMCWKCLLLLLLCSSFNLAI